MAMQLHIHILKNRFTSKKRRSTFSGVYDTATWSFLSVNKQEKKIDYSVRNDE